MATTSLSVSGKNLDKVPESLNVLYNVYNGLSIVRLVILVNTSGKVVQLRSDEKVEVKCQVTTGYLCSFH